MAFDWGIGVFSANTFAKLRKAAICFVMSIRPSVRPSVRMEQLGSPWTDFHEILYLRMSLNLLRKFNFH
jgi:hypothetical protein